MRRFLLKNMLDMTQSALLVDLRAASEAFSVVTVKNFQACSLWLGFFKKGLSILVRFRFTSVQGLYLFSLQFQAHML